MTGDISAVRIGWQKGGKIIAVHCVLHYSKPVSADTAVTRVQAGKSAFVAAEDVHTVLDRLGVTDENYRA